MNKEELLHKETPKRMEAQVTYEFSYWIDEDFWNQDSLDEFSQVFFDVDDVDDIMEHVLHHIVHYGGKQFIDGVGYLMINGRYPYGAKDEECCTTIKVNYRQPEAEYY